jgi:hypothetical protein
LKRSVTVSIAIGLIVVLGAFTYYFRALSSILPEQLVGAQIFRPAGEGNPAKLPLPTWFVDLHWHFAGKQVVERANRTHSNIVKYMLGVELRREEVGLPVDQVRFRTLMRQYVCENTSEIPSPAQISKYARLDSVPEYISALGYCGRLGVKH